MRVCICANVYIFFIGVRLPIKVGNRVREGAITCTYACVCVYVSRVSMLESNYALACVRAGLYMYVFVRPMYNVLIIEHQKCESSGHRTYKQNGKAGSNEL